MDITDLASVECSMMAIQSAELRQDMLLKTRAEEVEQRERQAMKQCHVDGCGSLIQSSAMLASSSAR